MENKSSPAAAGTVQPLAGPVVSICILNYEARDYLRQCLQSLAENTILDYEVIVVDNGSEEPIGEMLEQEFPGVRLIQNQCNEGYTRPMNQAMRVGAGRYLCQLNPDTLILPSAIDRLVRFMSNRPEVGICGPKVLNRDLTLQKPCRRGESRPWAVISYFTGLARLFPKSPLFGQYLMSYMDEDQIHPVAGVAGSCMIIRREVVDQIGYMDELFFAYQEDADYCLRAHQAGWEVYYMPEAQVVHYGGMGGSRVEPYRSIFEWHRSYYLFYKKHYAREYFFLFNLFYYFLMFIKLSLALLVNFLRKDKFAGSRKP